MDYQEPRCFKVDQMTGDLHGSETSYQKKLGDLGGIYRDVAAFERSVTDQVDRVVYEVRDYRATEARDDLIFGVTRMVPGKIGQEYFMTRGHIHARARRPEIYYGQQGLGVMLMESPEGETRTVEIAAQTVCYVPPFWIHRSVNVGDGDLVMTFAYPADSGQDYGIIARSNGMRSLIVDDGNGGWQEMANPDWQARTSEEISAVHQSGEDA